MRFLAVPRRTLLWLLWLTVVFGAMNVFGPSLGAWRRPADPPGVEWKELSERQTPLQRLMTRLRDDDDVDRYFAYAEATLGRPYAAGAIRPAGDTVGGSDARGPGGVETPARPLVPWRDFAVEYPPGMLAAALLPALATSDPDAYFRLFALAMEAALTLAVWLAVRTADRLEAGAGDGALAHATLVTLALGVIAVRRYDPTVALAIAAAVHALAARRPALSGAALGAAVALKGVPILLAPILAMYAWRLETRGRLPFPSLLGKSLPPGEDPGVARSAGWGAARLCAVERLARTFSQTCGVGVLLSLPHPSPSATPSPLRGEGGGRGGASWSDKGRPLVRFLLGLAGALVPAGLVYAAVADPRALDAFAYHGQRPIQAETIYSALLILARPLDPAIMGRHFGFGSLNVLSPAEPALRTLSMVLLLAGVLSSWAFAWTRLRAARDERARVLAVVRASLACLVAFITLGKVFSPQYCVWLVPLAAVAAPFVTATARRLLAFAFLMVQAEYPFLYGFLYSTLVPATAALIALRTVWLWLYVRAVTEAPRPLPPGEGSGP